MDDMDVDEVVSTTDWIRTKRLLSPLSDEHENEQTIYRPRRIRSKRDRDYRSSIDSFGVESSSSNRDWTNGTSPCLDSSGTYRNSSNTSLFGLSPDQDQMRCCARSIRSRGELRPRRDSSSYRRNSDSREFRDNRSLFEYPRERESSRYSSDSREFRSHRDSSSRISSDYYRKIGSSRDSTSRMRNDSREFRPNRDNRSRIWMSDSREVDSNRDSNSHRRNEYSSSLSTRYSRNSLDFRPKIKDDDTSSSSRRCEKYSNIFHTEKPHHDHKRSNSSLYVSQSSDRNYGGQRSFDRSSVRHIDHDMTSPTNKESSPITSSSPPVKRRLSRSPSPSLSISGLHGDADSDSGPGESERSPSPSISDGQRDEISSNQSPSSLTQNPDDDDDDDDEANTLTISLHPSPINSSLESDADEDEESEAEPEPSSEADPEPFSEVKVKSEPDQESELTSESAPKPATESKSNHGPQDQSKAIRDVKDFNRRTQEHDNEIAKLAADIQAQFIKTVDLAQLQWTYLLQFSRGHQAIQDRNIPTPSETCRGIGL